MESILVQSKKIKEHLAVQLADFGHTKHTTHGIRNCGTQDTSPSKFLPSSSYTPENTDRRAFDAFALGILLYILLSEHSMLPNVTYAVIGYEDLLIAGYVGAPKFIGWYVHGGFRETTSYGRLIEA
ncbi:hypothetical protein HK100_008027, partial [Physocladia obscura]